MFNLLHQIEVKSSVSKVLEAVSTQGGLSRWWTADNDSRPELGHVNIFRFDGGNVEFHFRVDEHDTDGVLWTCIAAPKVPPEWVDTIITFELEKTESVTVVKFAHRNWRREDGSMALCNTVWGSLMHRLREYVDNGTVNPYFEG